MRGVECLRKQQPWQIVMDGKLCNADVMELLDIGDLKSLGETRAGWSPAIRTLKTRLD